VRPCLRAPTFEEARSTAPVGGVALAIELDK
jgi:hypothetical protein